MHICHTCICIYIGHRRHWFSSPVVVVAWFPVVATILSQPPLPSIYCSLLPLGFSSCCSFPSNTDVAPLPRPPPLVQLLLAVADLPIADVAGFTNRDSAASIRRVSSRPVALGSRRIWASPASPPSPPTVGSAPPVAGRPSPSRCLPRPWSPPDPDWRPAPSLERRPRRSGRRCSSSSRGNPSSPRAHRVRSTLAGRVLSTF